RNALAQKAMSRFSRTSAHTAATNASRSARKRAVPAGCSTCFRAWPGSRHQATDRARACPMNPKGVVVSLILYETTRAFRPTVGVADSLLSATPPQAGRPMEGRPDHPQWHLLAAEHRRPLARPARTLRQVENRPRPLHQAPPEWPA